MRFSRNNQYHLSFFKLAFGSLGGVLNIRELLYLPAYNFYNLTFSSIFLYILCFKNLAALANFVSMKYVKFFQNRIRLVSSQKALVLINSVKAIRFAYFPGSTLLQITEFSKIKKQNFCFSPQFCFFCIKIACCVQNYQKYRLP